MQGNIKTKLPKIALVGRPNVGKSRLFNRIAGKRKAIVESVAGTTRDRIYKDIKWKEKYFTLIDTGGLDLSAPEGIKMLAKKQTQIAIDEADILVLVCDLTQGITPLDQEIATLLRKTNKKTVLAVNKVDTASLEPEAFEFYSLGLGQPLAVSAIHGNGVEELLKNITDEIAFVGIEKQKQAIRVAITGRPNVGKSSFLNCILKEERAVVDEHPGTTRDSIDTYFEKANSAYILIDTAGIRHKKKVKEVVEYFGFARAKESIRRSDVCLILIDAQEGLVSDDLSLISYIQQEGRGMILVANKWDMVQDVTESDYKEYLRRRANFLNNIPIIFTSSLTGQNVIKSLGLVCNVEKNSRHTIDTKSLNQILRTISKRTPPPVREGKRPRLGYISQIGVKPPTFIIFSTMPKQIPQGYLNFVENKIRKGFNFEGVPLKIILKKKKERE